MKFKVFTFFALLNLIVLPVKLFAESTGHDYKVTGEIVRMPGAGSASREVFIRHEKIPDFVDIDGSVVGMEAMTMPFPVAEGIKLDEFKVGDKVAFNYHFDWKGKPPEMITSLKKVGQSRLEAVPNSPEVSKSDSK